jgi:hypothetical protein
VYLRDGVVQRIFLEPAPLPAKICEHASHAAICAVAVSLFPAMISAAAKKGTKAHKPAPAENEPASQPAHGWQLIVGFEASAKANTQDFDEKLFVHPDGSVVILTESSVGDTKEGAKTGFALTWVSAAGEPIKTRWLGYFEGDLRGYLSLELADGGFVFGGPGVVRGGIDHGLARFDSDGQLLWNRGYEWPETAASFSLAAAVTAGEAAAGSTCSS